MGKPAIFYFFRKKPIAPTSPGRYESWRGIADLSGSTNHERLRVEG